MYIYFGSEVLPAAQKHISKKIEMMYPRHSPFMVWVNAHTEDNLQLYPLYARDGILTQDAFLPLNQYLLTLHKGAKIILQNTPVRILGGFTYSRGGYFWNGQSVSVDPEGILSFTVSICSMEELDIGIYYHGAGFEHRTKRTVINHLYSPFCRLEEKTDVNIRFYPSVPGRKKDFRNIRTYKKNSVSFQKKCQLETYFTSIYGEPVSMCFDQEFSFVLSERSDINGYPVSYYAPEGKAQADGAKKLMLGLSGTEYAELTEQTEIGFLAGNKAYFDSQKIHAQPTTSYLMAEGAVYFSQPQLSNFFWQNNESIRAYADLPGAEMRTALFPAFPYANGRYSTEMAKYVENTYLSPAREKQIAALLPCGGIFSSLFCSPRNGNTLNYAVTRHGMKAAVEENKIRWLQLVSADDAEPGIAFTAMNPSFYLGMLSSSLFIALNSLKGYASTPYAITVSRLLAAKSKGYPDIQIIAPLIGTTYPDHRSLEKEIEKLGAKVNSVLFEACDCFNICIAGWTFTMSPGSWEKQNTLFLTKLNMEHSISELTGMVHTWSIHPDPETVEKIQKQLASIEKQSETPGYENLQKILHDKSWRGTVFFSVGVDLDTLPKELHFLTNGMDPKNFHASYVAFPAAGLDDNGIQPVYALIDYNDPEHLHFEDEREFGFKVLSLRLEIENGMISAFSSRVELLMNRLFNSSCTGYGSAAGSNIVFDGSYQRQDGGSFYSFAISSPQCYALTECAITNLTVLEASLQTGREGCQFVLGGTLSFLEHPGMDIFSYERIGFNSFTISMKPEGKGYEFEALTESLRLNPNEALCRRGALAATFPVKAAGLVETAGQRVTAYGYSPLKIKNGTDEAEFGDNWFGIVWEIETGNLGGLASATNLTLKLLTAWNYHPKTEERAPGEASSSALRVTAGISISANKLPNDWSLPLQGVMTLCFDTIELHFERDFYFKFRNFSVTILGKRFPDTNNDMYLIGDGEGRLGWYGTL